MITGELKNKIDGLWDVFASGRIGKSSGGNRTDNVFNVYP